MPDLNIIYDVKAENQLKAFDDESQLQIKSDITNDLPCFASICKRYLEVPWAHCGAGSIRSVASQQFDILVHLECEQNRIMVLNILRKQFPEIREGLGPDIGFTAGAVKQFDALNYEIQRQLARALTQLYTNVFAHDDGNEDYFRLETEGYMVLTRADRKNDVLMVLNIEWNKVEAEPASWRIEFDKKGRERFDRLNTAVQTQMWRELHTTLVEELNRQPEIKDHDILNYFWPFRCVNDEYRVLCVLNSAKKTACVLDIEYRPIPGR